MVWFRVNDGLFSSQKWSKTSSKARGLWVTSGSWCAFNLTDGNVPSNMLRTLGGTAAAAQNLVDVGLWHKEEDGWSFHDWADYNPTRASVLQERAAAAARVAKHRQKQQDERDRRNGVSNSAPPRAQSPTRPDPISTSMAGESSSSYVSEREGDDGPTTNPARWRIITPPGAVPAGVDPDAEWDRFIDRNADTTLKDPRAAWLGWLRTAGERLGPKIGDRPTLVPSRPTCPDHPGQPTGSVQCPECARTTGPPPKSLRELRAEQATDDGPTAATG